MLLLIVLLFAFGLRRVVVCCVGFWLVVICDCLTVSLVVCCLCRFVVLVGLFRFVAGLIFGFG